MEKKSDVFAAEDAGSPRRLTVIKTYDIARKGHVSSRHLQISQNDHPLYKVEIESSDSPTITLQRPDQHHDEYAASVRQRRKHHDMDLIVEGTVARSEVVMHDGEGGSMDPYHVFKAGIRWKAWHNTTFNLVQIHKLDGTDDKTYGSRDWRLVELEGQDAMPKREAEDVRAVYIEEETSLRHPQAASVHWIAELGDGEKAACLAVLMGILDRKRRSSKEYRSGTSLLFG